MQKYYKINGSILGSSLAKLSHSLAQLSPSLFHYFKYLLFQDITIQLIGFEQIVILRASKVIQSSLPKYRFDTEKPCLSYIIVYIIQFLVQKGHGQLHNSFILLNSIKMSNEKLVGVLCADDLNPHMLCKHCLYKIKTMKDLSF